MIVKVSDTLTQLSDDLIQLQVLRGDKNAEGARITFHRSFYSYTRCLLSTIPS